MKADAFTHVVPKPYFEHLNRVLGAPLPYLSKRLATLPELMDLTSRLRVMDRFGIDRQVIALASPPIETVVSDPARAAELAWIANDGIADFAVRRPDRFIPVGTMAMNNPEACLRETERCLDDLGMKGMLIYSSAAGRPIDGEAFWPLYEMVAERGVPIWLHPARGESRADYVGEETSKWSIWHIFGWPYETSAAMTRLVFAGLFDRLPTIKVIVHHAGAMVPFFDKRIENGYLRLQRFEGQELGLRRAPLDYFRMFYADTAVEGSVGALTAAIAFYGVGHLVFATDTPFDGEGGARMIPATIFSVDALMLPPADRELIYHGNLERLIGIE